MLAIATGCLLSAESVWAQGAGAKNKEGNRLYEKGRYQEAEKAYLEAEAKMPGRPELSYNLGNSLIKQRKFSQALQALRQAASRGDKGLQVNSWYNTGNALFDMGSYKQAVQAYVEALRLDPADRDAKHNLEIALNKMQEQRQEQQQGEQGAKQESNQAKPQGGSEGEEKDQPKPQGSREQPDAQPDQKPANPLSSQSQPQQGTFSRERALQILDALQNQELAEQRRLLERQPRKKAGGRDW